MSLLSVMCDWTILLEIQATERGDMEAANYWSQVSMRLLMSRCFRAVEGVVEAYL